MDVNIQFKMSIFLSVSNAFALSLRSTIDCDKPFQAAMTRRMKLCLRTFVQKNGRIKYLECMCLVLRVGVDKCCKGRADRESRPFVKLYQCISFSAPLQRLPAQDVRQVVCCRARFKVLVV